MPTQKNQHYVPQFYLKLFSSDGNTIGVYVFGHGKKIDAAPIRSQASENYLYTLDTDRPKNTEKSLSELEGAAKQVIEMLIQTPPKQLNHEQKFTLLSFIIIQLGRTLSNMDIIQETGDKMLRQLLRAQKKIQTKGGDDKFESITEDNINNLGLRFANLGAFSVFSHLKMIPSCIDIVDNYKVLVNKTQLSFATSDNPVCQYNMFLEKVKHYNIGLGNRGIMLYLPISPDRALLYYDSKVYKCGNTRQKVVNLVDEHDVWELNKLAAVNSRVVFFYNPNKAATITLEQMAIQKKRFSLQEQVKDLSFVDSVSGNPIVGAHIVGKQCNLHLSFIKYLPAYAMKNSQSFNPDTDMYREIAYFKDELEKEFFGDSE